MGAGMMASRRLPALCFGLVTALFVGGFVLGWLAGDPVNLVDATTAGFYLFPVVGLLITYRRPRNLIGWLCLSVGLAWGVESFCWGVALYGMVNPGTIASPEIWAAVGNPFWVPGVFLAPTFLLLVFPDGRLLSPRWRVPAWVTGLALLVVFVGTFLQPTPSGYGRPEIANPFHPDGTLGEFLFFIWDSGLVFVLLLGSVVACVSSVIVRFRRSSGIEREQLKWLCAAGVLATCAFVPSILLEEVYGEALPLAAGLTFALIPVAIGIAVTRYRLYDIDRIISRAVSYTVVIGVLAGLYFVVVRWLSSFLPADSDLAVAGSTLSVAAAFNPLRRWVRRWVDRRFNRGRYNSELVIDTFSHSLRNRVDQDRIVDEWVGLVVETMQPASVGLWLTASTSVGEGGVEASAFSIHGVRP